MVRIICFNVQYLLLVILFSTTTVTDANANISGTSFSFLVCNLSPDSRDFNENKLTSPVPVYLNVLNQTFQMLRDEDVWKFQSLSTPLAVVCTIKQEIRAVIERSRQQGISVDLQRIRQNLRMVLEANLSDSLTMVMNAAHHPLTTEQEKTAGESFLRAAIDADFFNRMPLLSPVEATLKNQDFIHYTLASDHNDHNLVQILQNLLMLLEVKLDEELCRLAAEQGTTETKDSADECKSIVVGVVTHPQGQDKKQGENKNVAGSRNSQHANTQSSGATQQPVNNDHPSDQESGDRGNNNEPCHVHKGSTCPHPDCHNGPCRCHECLHSDTIQSRGIRKQRFSAEHLTDSIPDAYKVLLAPPIELPPETVIRQLYPEAHILEQSSDTESLVQSQLPHRSRRQSAPGLAMTDTREIRGANPVRASTENESRYTNLENKTVEEILKEINAEDKQVTSALKDSRSNILELLHKVQKTIHRHGRVFLIGAGSSGRLAIVSSAATPEKLVALIAGGDAAIATSKGGAEDSFTSAWQELSEQHNINRNDLLIGISASGRTPYALAALAIARQQGITTGSIACSSHAKMSGFSDAPVEINAGPEYITGSTRMKSATAQKIILDMISMVALNPDQDLEALLQRFIKGSSDITGAISQSLPQLTALVEKVIPILQNQGRLIYLGNGLPGRLSVIDASECPPTFGVEHSTVTGLIEGGIEAFRHTPASTPQDNASAGQDLIRQGVTGADIVVGVGIDNISGYVQDGLTRSNTEGTATALIMVDSQPDKTDQQNVIISIPSAENPAEYEALAGTAIRQMLNMLTTSAMIRLDRVAGNRMSHMHASNEKLVAREAVNLASIEGITLLAARMLLTIFKSTAAVMKYLREIEKSLEPQ